MSLDPNAAVFAMPTDEIGHLAAVTLSTGTADAKYPVTNVQTFDPSEVFLSTSTGGIDIDFDSGSAKDVQAASLHHHNLPVGTVGHWYRGATQGSTTLDAPFTIAAYPQTGLPLPIGTDLTAASGYSGGGFRWTRLHIPSVGQKTGLGSVMLWATERQTIRNVVYDVKDGERQPATVLRTSYGVKRARSLGVRLRQHPATFFFATDAQYAAFLALFRACQGQVNAFLWGRNPLNSDWFLAGFSEDALASSLPINGVHQLTMTIEELACGKALPTA